MPVSEHILPPARARLLRIFSFVNGAVWGALGVALYARAAWATSLWPWPDVGMSYVFLASILAAIAAPSIWIGVTREFAAFAGVGLNTMVVNAGTGAYLAWRAFRWDEPLAGAIGLCVVAFALGAAFAFGCRHLAVRDARPMPALVRGMFVVFGVILLLVGGALALQVPRVFPWNLQPQSSTLFGIIFLGAAIYFFHAVARGRWAYAAPPLWAFLAYDLVLFAPYLRLLGGSADGAAFVDEYGGAADPASAINFPSLSIYLTVLAASTLLAAYMFLVDSRTRLFGAAARAARVERSA